MRIAIAHEWLDQRAGSEKTFEALAAAFPEADLFALTRSSADFDFGGRIVHTTFLDRLGPLREKRGALLPLMPAAWRTVSKERYDLVITSSHACAKGFYPGRSAPHLCYCHTPMRYAWLPDVDRRGQKAKLVGPFFRSWDRRSAKWVDSFAANSMEVRDRIRTFYHREARVIPPPVDTEFFTPGGDPKGDYILAVSRFIAYKRIDLAIRAAALADVPIVVAGRGPDEGRLRELAEAIHPRHVRFVIGPSSEELRTLYRRARALVYPAHEDFGIVPVEAQACGAPVVGPRLGGLIDTVIDGSTGILVEGQTSAALADGVRAALGLSDAPQRCVRHARQFSKKKFEERILEWAASEVGS